MINFGYMNKLLVKLHLGNMRIYYFVTNHLISNNFYFGADYSFASYTLIIFWKLDQFHVLSVMTKFILFLHYGFPIA